MKPVLQRRCIWYVAGKEAVRFGIFIYDDPHTDMVNNLVRMVYTG
jgi:hypothetical protein